jgi:hypothetical protein
LLRIHTRYPVLVVVSNSLLKVAGGCKNLWKPTEKTIEKEKTRPGKGNEQQRRKDKTIIE